MVLDDDTSAISTIRGREGNVIGARSSVRSMTLFQQCQPFQTIEVQKEEGEEKHEKQAGMKENRPNYEKCRNIARQRLLQ